jgi:hypothetical protein
MRPLVICFFALAPRILAQSSAFTACSEAKAWLPCEIQLELDATEAQAHPEPWRSVELKAEVKSPRFRTFLAEAFWAGARKLTIRFTPTEAGRWEFKLSSNLKRLDNLSGSVEASASDLAGFIQRANVHHWRSLGNLKPHLWHGADVWDWTNQGAENIAALKGRKVTHVRTLLAPQWPPDPAKFASFETALAAWNAEGMVVDVVLAGPANEFTNVLKDWAARERYLRYVMARLSPYNVTWELARDWETYRDPRTVLKDMAAVIQKYDSYAHPRSAYPQGSTSAFVKDGWMTHLLVNASLPAAIAVEHQLYGLPLIAVAKGKVFEAVFSGSYAGSGANEILGGVLEKTRYWELEPYFDVSNGRALALEGTEYLVLVDRPGIVEVEVEKHGYDVAWINLASGERIPQKEWKGEHFIGETPARTGEWILHLSREGRKEGMLTSYKFESRPILAQEIEVDPKRLPFTINIPDNTDLKAGAAIPFEIKIVKDTRATRFMQYHVSVDVPTEPQGLRIVSTEAKGTFTIPVNVATRFPAVLNLRVTGMNANGKVYALDRVVRLTQ